MSKSNQKYEIIRYPEVESTNAVAFNLANSGAKHGTVVLADRQSGGKGRLSRKFESPPGGLYMSLVLRPELQLTDLPLVTLAAGVASALTVEKCSNVSVALKWPNDLYIHEKKLGGILTEGASYSNQTSSIPFVITGIGINVNTRIDMLSQSMQRRVTSLKAETGREQDIDQVVRVLVEEVLAMVEELQVDAGKVLQKWRKKDYLSGKCVEWRMPSGEIIKGTGAGLLPDGRYGLTTSDGDDYSVLAGDIVLTKINGRQIK